MERHLSTSTDDLNPNLHRRYTDIPNLHSHSMNLQNSSPNIENESERSAQTSQHSASHTTSTQSAKIRSSWRLDAERLQAAELYERWVDPPAEYRAIPFWSWNDRLEPEEIRRQIREMKQAGLGGFIMHARAGLETPYMGDEWMDCIAAGIDEGQKLGMRVWCYDENGWPSGFADGVVPALGLRYQQKWLRMEWLHEGEVDRTDIKPSFVTAEQTITWYRWNAGRCEHLSEDQAHLADLRLYYELNPYYIDTLDEHVVYAFIESTYERYADRFADHFGKAVAGIFTDEPQYGRNQIPWSFTLQEQYERAYGTDLMEHLPLLFVEGEGHEEIRYRFWQLVTQLFSQSFMQQIGDWCEEKGIRLTGHVVSEDHLTAQTGAVGDAMASYEYMQVPGIDWLGRFIDNPITPKQVSSVAHQLGQKFVLSETFGCSGWNVSFADLKWIAEWQYVHGINLMCQHLQGYSLRGIRKRDYPPSLYYQQPWWNQYHQFNDYFGRLSMLLAESTVEAEILLLHPIRSSWLAYSHPVDGAEASIQREQQDGRDRGERINENFAQISEWLGALHYGHDYGSETIMEHHGRMEGKRLVVGQAAYSTIILPPMSTLASTTLELLLRFSEQGGRIVALGAFPERVDGKKDEHLADLAELELRTPCLPLELSALANYLKQHMPASLVLKQLQCQSDYVNLENGGAQEVELSMLDPVKESPLLSRIHHVDSLGNPSGSENVQLTLQQDQAGLEPDRLLYIVNSDREQGYTAEFEWCSSHREDGNEGQVRVERMNLEQGTIHEVPVQRNSEGHVQLLLNFAPAQSVMLRIRYENANISTLANETIPSHSYSIFGTGENIIADLGEVIPTQPVYEAGMTIASAQTSSVTLSDQDWRMAQSDPNSITLDQCRWRISGGEWSDREPVIFVQQHLVKLGRAVDIELQYSVHIASGVDLDQAWSLALEQPQRYQIWINDREVIQREQGWWRDIAFRRLDIRGFLQAGENRIVLATHFANSEETYAAAARAEAFESEGNKLFFDTELESIYILGHFDVQSMSEYTFKDDDAITTEGPFELTKPSNTVRTGDLTTQGLLFYAGNVQLTRSIRVDALGAGERVWLVCERPHAVLSRVLINGQDGHTWMWAPYEVDITDWLQLGENELTIELLSSCRNLLGPHHHVRGELKMVGPDSFTDRPSWTDVPFEGDSIYVDRYCMVRFGLAREPRLVIRSGKSV